MLKVCNVVRIESEENLGSRLHVFVSFQAWSFNRRQSYESGWHFLEIFLAILWILLRSVFIPRHVFHLKVSQWKAPLSERPLKRLSVCCLFPDDRRLPTGSGITEWVWVSTGFTHLRRGPQSGRWADPLFRHGLWYSIPLAKEIICPPIWNLDLHFSGTYACESKSNSVSISFSGNLRKNWGCLGNQTSSRGTSLGIRGGFTESTRTKEWNRNQSLPHQPHPNSVSYTYTLTHSFPVLPENPPHCATLQGRLCTRWQSGFRRWRASFCGRPTSSAVTWCCTTGPLSRSPGT